MLYKAVVIIREIEGEVFGALRISDVDYVPSNKFKMHSHMNNSCTAHLGTRWPIVLQRLARSFDLRRTGQGLWLDNDSAPARSRNYPAKRSVCVSARHLRVAYEVRNSGLSSIFARLDVSCNAALSLVRYD